MVRYFKKELEDNKVQALVECLEIFPELDEILAEGIDDPARIDKNTAKLVLRARTIFPTYRQKED